LSRDEAPLRALYVCYLSLEDPLVHTQVVAYLAGLSKLGHTVHLLTFETSGLTRSRRRELRATLADRGITWHGLRYHKRPTLVATSVDVASGAVVAAFLIRRHRLVAFHARSHVPAAMALLASWLSPFRLIFDMRGLMAEENVDAGRWRRPSLPFKLAKAVDQIEAARSQRDETRSRLGLDGRTVLIYVGKFTGWYMEREMVEFFAIATERSPDTHFLILTQSEPGLVEGEFTRLGIDRSSWTITRVAPPLVGAYLAAADAAIAFIRPSFSKLSSSPTKVAEYLAAGLPMICIAGVGDVDQLLHKHGVGVLLTGWERPQLTRGARELAALIGDEGVAQRARMAARNELSLSRIGIPAYDALYHGVSGL
jgi:glycosyltransferase involved in cell wall biosynthesis